MGQICRDGRVQGQNNKFLCSFLNSFPFDNKDWLCQQYWDLGKSCRQIAEELDVGEWIIYKRFKKLGISHRTTSEMARKRRGEKHPSWKGGANIKRICKQCGKTFKVTPANFRGGGCVFCSRKCMGDWQAENWKGENHPSWRGGLKPYPPEFTEKLKEQIRERDNYTCQKCGRTQEEELKEFNRRLAIHHIDHNKQNCKKENLLTLCLKCNSEVNGRKMFWMGYLCGKMGIKITYEQLALF